MNKEVISAFNKSHKIYETHKIKVVLIRKNIILSYRKIRFIMIKNNLVFKYTKLKYRNHKTTANNAQISNVLNRKFNDQKSMKALLIIEHMCKLVENYTIFVY